MESKNTEIVDIEECPQADRPRPRRQLYLIRIDRESFLVEVPCMTGRDLLTLAGKCPSEQYQIFQKLRSGKLDMVGLDEKADFTEPGLERFVTLPLDQTEGRAMRREFPLPERDVEYLDERRLPWETVHDGCVGWVLIHEYPLPDGLKPNTVSLSLRIEPGYPETEIDMVYFFPRITRIDGKAIPQVRGVANAWQRWSRHRTTKNPWRRGIDDISTHLALVRHWLVRESRRP